MIMKWRDMDRVMAATSQKLLHGGMRTRDWFSDKLEKVKTIIGKDAKRKQRPRDGYDIQQRYLAQQSFSYQDFIYSLQC